MECRIKITSVIGVVDDQGELTSIKIEGKVEGKAQDCRRVGITVECGHQHTLEEDVKHDDTFEKIFTGGDLSQTECSCGREISVRVFCLANTNCEPGLWKEKLKCEREQALPSNESQGPVAQGCKNAYHLIRECTAPDVARGPQYIIPFHQLLGVLPLKTPTSGIEQSPAATATGPLPTLAAAILRQAGDLSVQLGAHLQYEQRWFFQQLCIADVVSSIALAPMEELSLRFHKTQRKRLTQKTIDSVEEMQSTESSLVDKDVLNVTRSSSQTDGWNIASNASVGLTTEVFTAGLGVSPTYSETTTNAAQSSVQQINETTRKSARTLKTLQQTEVEEVSETTIEDSAHRKIRNPYRDRSLLLKIFQLEKHFCVETTLTFVRPALMLIVNGIDFNRDFILRSRRFLDQVMIDRDLAFQMTSALDRNDVYDVENAPGQSKHHAIRIASLALAYLFEIKNVFQLPAHKYIDSAGPWEASDEEVNDPAWSLTAQGPRPALHDALSNNFGPLFTALNMYYSIYQDKIVKNRKPGMALGEPVLSSDPLDELLPVEMAVSLEQYITPLWTGKEQVESGPMNNVLDTEDRTEVFRRLSGFQSLVQGILRPMLEPLKDEKERWEAAKRADWVLARVEGHLKAHAKYYTIKYLEHLSQQVGLDLVRGFAKQTLDGVWLTDQNQRDLARKLFDPAKAFVDRNVIAVPLRDGVEHAEIKEFDPGGIFDGQEDFTDEALGVGKWDIKPVDVEVPFDGLHIEAVPGSCPKLPDLAADSAEEEAEVFVKARSW